MITNDLLPLSDILLSDPCEEVAHIEPLVTLAPHPATSQSLSATIQSSNTTFVPWND